MPTVRRTLPLSHVLLHESNVARLVDSNETISVMPTYSEVPQYSQLKNVVAVDSNFDFSSSSNLESSSQNAIPNNCSVEECHKENFQNFLIYEEKYSQST